MDAKLKEIVDNHRGKPGLIISILEQVQEEYGYLPKDALIEVSSLIETPLAQLFGVATFYSAFTMKPRGKHTIHVCLGTACHVRGAPKIVDEISRELDVPAGDTTDDQQFTLETVRCIGCCSLAPVMTIDENIYGYNTMAKAGKIVSKYKE